jgi:crotonobetainyl-CoA:carnitine CoA-transferase CaiB-like acyl-CoA transferase
MLLADLGAEVIKVELPGRGDDGRYGYPSVDGVPLAHLALNRNKKCITLDLRTPQGQEIARRLAAQADALVENFTPGTMAKWGMGYESLRQLNPRLVYAALSGFGQTGPYAHRPSYDIIAQAMGGLMSITGFPEMPPTRGGGALADFIGGVFTAFGLVCALFHARLTGEGQFVDVSNMEAILSMTDNWITITGMTGQEPTRMGNRHPFTAPYDCFRAKDGWVVIAVGNSALFRSLMTALGKPELGRDPRFKSPQARLENHEAVHRVVADWVEQRTVAEVLQVLGPDGANLPCAPVLSMAELLRDPHLRQRGGIQWVAHRQLGEVPVVRTPIEFSATPAQIQWLGPELGAHNEEVYGKMLNLGAQDLEELKKNGVI